MGLLGIQFNIFNIIISSFTFGLGIDYSIFLLSGIQNNYKYGVQKLARYKTSIILSVITTLVGMGVLIFAKHPALKSIAIMAMISILTVLIICFTIQPLLFRWLIYQGAKKRRYPLTFKNLLFSCIIFILFLLACVLLSLIIPVFKIFPYPSEKKKYAFRHLMMYAFRSIHFIIPAIKIKINNPFDENFEKPAVIISNHQSHLDLMMILMLSPNIVALTNDWVWNNIFYGFIIRYAGFIHLAGGIDASADKLNQLIKKNQSVLIFPEGTRSTDHKIKRFRQGAFEIAEKMKMDILPVILQGTGDCMPKGEVLIKTGSVSINILQRIENKNDTFGKTRREKGRILRNFMTQKYAEIIAQEQAPDYYNKMVINNFLYKGPILEWYVRIKMKLEKYYRQIHLLIPHKATITDLGCGYGYMDFMLHLLSPERLITAIDYDDDKILVAKNCNFSNEKVQFITADITKYNPEKSDIFILGDVLHYTTFDNQKKLIENCAKKLNSNGKIIIRDANKKSKKHKKTVLTEIFSTGTGFNKKSASDKKLYFFDSEWIEKLALKNKLHFKAIEQSKHTSNTIFILSKTKGLPDIRANA